MAARPLTLSFAAASLALVLAVPAVHAQTMIGSGNIQVNLQALDQLGGGNPFGVNTPAPGPLLGATGRSVASKTASSPTVSGPAPLLGETSVARPAPAKPKAARSTARPAVASAQLPAKASTPEVSAAPAASAGQSAPEATPAAPPAQAVIPAPAAPGAPQPIVPSPVAPAAPTAAVEPPTPAPAPAAAPTAPAAPLPQVAAAPVAPAAPAANPATQQSALVAPPAPAAAPGIQGGVVTIPFQPGQGELPAGDLAVLDGLVKQFAGNEERLQVRAYAANTVGDGGSGARRLSLTRALAVRQYLIDKGIRSTRIDVRALGVPTDGTAPDRVEVAPPGR